MLLIQVEETCEVFSQVRSIEKKHSITFGDIQEGILYDLIELQIYKVDFNDLFSHSADFTSTGYRSLKYGYFKCIEQMAPRDQVCKTGEFLKSKHLLTFLHLVH